MDMICTLENIPYQRNCRNDVVHFSLILCNQEAENGKKF